METAFIIGGGPSLKGFNFAPLAGRETFGVNLAAEAAGTKYLVSIDRNFCFNFPGLIDSFGGRAHVAPIDAGLIGKFPKARIYTRSKRRSLFEDDPNALPGLNSGFAAFALAVRMGFRRIALLGLDMNQGGGNFHRGYAWPGSPDGVVKEWIADFDRAARAECFEFGIDVTNYSPDSAITGFPKLPLAELTAELLSSRKGARR